MRKYPEILHRIIDFCISYRNLAQLSRHPVKSNKRYKPFFIIGSGRSGNTLLRRLLNNHSELVIPPETYVLGKVIKRYRQNSGMEWKDLIEYVFAAFEFYPEFESFDISLQPLVQELKDSPAEDRNLAYILNRFYIYCCQSTGHGAIRWGDKTPLNTFQLERIFTVFPDAKFIHILRDGCDVVSSYVHAGIYNSIEEAAERWSESIRLVDKFYNCHPDVGITIRYEELVSNPESVLMKVSSFLDIEYEERMLQLPTNANDIVLGDVERHAHHANVLKPISTSSIGKGRNSLSAEQKLVVEKMIGQQLKRLGYQSCTS